MNDFYRRVRLLMQLADANERAEKAEADLAAALAANRDCVDHLEQIKAELTVLRYRTGIYTEQERAMDKSFTESEARERERFEAWYTTHAFNYSRDPIGSRDCSLQWEAWKAARADLLEVPERLAEALLVIRQHVAKDPSAPAASIISTCDVALATHFAQAQSPSEEIRRPSPDWFDQRLHENLMPHKTATPPAEGVTNEMVERASRALCQSGKFETGQGTCALICMGELGNARQGGCPCKVRVHERLARLVLEAALAVQENPNG